MTDDTAFDLSALEDLSDEDLQDLAEAIYGGATCPAEAFGFGPEAQATVENIALSYYRTKYHDKATQIFSFLIRLAPRRASAWRGLGACCQAKGHFAQAAECYGIATVQDPTDIISRIYLGECLCQADQKTAGLDFLRTAVDDAGDDPQFRFHVTRAKAIIQAKGGIPPRVVLRNKALQVAEQASQELARQGAGGEGKQQPDGAAPAAKDEITPADMRNNPVLQEDLAALWKAVQSGDLTLGEIGGFTADELYGAYACACKYVEQDDALRAMQILGWLLFLDPYNGKYYQLLGIIVQRHQGHAASIEYYDLALDFDPNNAMTHVYRGEAKIMIGQREEGLNDVARGIELGGDDGAHASIVKRGRVLQKQFGDPPQ